MPRKTVLALLACSTLATAEPSSSQQPRPKPEPTDPKLAQLVGRWEGKTVLTIRDTTTQVKTTMHCQRAVVGPPLVCTGVAAGGERRLEEVHLIGYDRASDTYHLFTVNNWGEAYDHAAKWTDRARVTFVHEGLRNGKPLRETYTYEIARDKLQLSGTISVDGKVFGEAVTNLQRVP